MRWFILILVVVCTCCLGPANVSAHGLFWQLEGKSWFLMQGHPPGQEHHDEPAVYCDPARIKALFKGESGDMSNVSWHNLPVGDPASIPSDVPLTFALLDWGWWTKTADGTVNKHPDNVPGALKAWKSRETIKHINDWLKNADRPVGMELEISPAENPLVKNQGEKISFIVTLNRKPVAGAVVTYGGQIRGTTGSDGSIRIKLRNGGYQEIRTTLRKKLTSPSWAEDVQTATLTFRLNN